MELIEKVLPLRQFKVFSWTAPIIDSQHVITTTFFNFY
jgi:hypothetical protein